jgi:hypothetical protein
MAHLACGGHASADQAVLGVPLTLSAAPRVLFTYSAAMRRVSVPTILTALVAGIAIWLSFGSLAVTVAASSRRIKLLPPFLVAGALHGSERRTALWSCESQTRHARRHVVAPDPAPVAADPGS